MRISPILRRTDNRVSIRGIQMYPEHMEALLKRIDPAMEDFRLLIHTRYGIGEQMEIMIVRHSTRDFPEGSRSQYLDALRTQVRRALGLAVRVQLVEHDRLPKEGLLYKTVFRGTPPLCAME